MDTEKIVDFLGSLLQLLHIIVYDLIVPGLHIAILALENLPEAPLRTSKDCRESASIHFFYGILRPAPLVRRV